VALLLPVLIGGCSSWWPFGSSGELSRVPAGATEFACAQGRTLYVRFTDDAKSAWVILPEREFRLERSSAERYVSETTTLSLQGDEVNLDIEGHRAYVDCRRMSK
jgi:hypothetical protein